MLVAWPTSTFLWSKIARLAIFTAKRPPRWFRNARRAKRERCADRCNARDDSGKGAGTRMSPNRSGSSFRDGAMTALGGKISYGCPRYCLARGIVAREEPQSDSWASGKDL